MPDESSQNDAARRAMLIDALKQTFDATLDVRIDRYLRAEHHPMVSNTTFAAASSECLDLFRDGHFYGCISLCQAVGEALLRYMCKANSCRAASDYDKNLAVLVRRKFADSEFEKNARTLWARRNDYHHLNPGVATDLAELESIAFSKIRALAELESWVFAFSVNEGKIRPKRPQYWPQAEDGKLEVFLRFSP